jgi:hypothetical protein
MGRNYSELAPIVALLRDNVCMERARIRSPERTGFGPCPRRAPRRSNERARHPSAICMIEGHILIRNEV